MSGGAEYSKGYKALRRALFDRTKKSKQWLSREVAKRMRNAPMTVRVAQAVVAHDEGIRIERYLVDKDLEDVRQAIRDISAAGQHRSTPSAGVHAKRSAVKRGVPNARLLVFKAA